MTLGTGCLLKHPASTAMVAPPGYHPGVPGSDVETPIEASPETPGLPALALALFLLASCTTIVLAGGGPDGAPYLLRWNVVLSDVFLGLLVVTQLAELSVLRRDWRAHRCALAAVVLAVSLLPSLVAHPSGRGDVALFRWIGVAMVALAVARLSGSGRILVLGAFAGATVLQVVIALAQRAANAPVGLDSLGEANAIEIGGRFASAGLTVHPYVFAAWCAVAGGLMLAALARAEDRSIALTVATIAPFVGVGLTMSRAGVLAVGLVLMSFGVAGLRIRRLRVLLLVAAVCTALGIMLDLSGWASRASETTAGSDVTNNRGQLLEQARGLLKDNPALGVGPGRYVEALVERPDLVKLSTQKGSRPVHLVPYLILVEGGLMALPALLFIAWATLTQTWRAGVLGVGVTMGILPFLLLDRLNWSYPQGLMLTGLWLGTLDQLSAR